MTKLRLLSLGALVPALVQLSSCGPAAIGALAGSGGGGGTQTISAGTTGLSVRANEQQGSADRFEFLLVLDQSAATAEVAQELQLELTATVNDAGEDRVVTIDPQTVEVALSGATAGRSLTFDDAASRWIAAGVRSADDGGLTATLTWDFRTNLAAALGGAALPAEIRDVRIGLSGNRRDDADETESTSTTVTLGQAVGTAAVAEIRYVDGNRTPNGAPDEGNVIVRGTYADFGRVGGDNPARIRLIAEIPIDGGGVEEVELTPEDPTRLENFANETVPASFREAATYEWEATFSPITNNLPPGLYDPMTIRAEIFETENPARIPVPDPSMPGEIGPAVGTQDVTIGIGIPPMVTLVDLPEEMNSLPRFQVPIRAQVTNASSFSQALRVSYVVKYRVEGSATEHTAVAVSAPVTELANGDTETVFINWRLDEEFGLGVAPNTFRVRVAVQPCLLGYVNPGSPLAMAASAPLKSSEPLMFSTGSGASNFDQIFTKPFSEDMFDNLTEPDNPTDRNGVVEDNVGVLIGSELRLSGTSRLSSPNRTRDILYTASAPGSVEESHIGAIQQYSAVSRLVPTPTVQLQGQSDRMDCMPGSRRVDPAIGFGFDAVLPLDLNPDGPDAVVLHGSNNQHTYVQWRGGAAGDPLSGPVVPIRTRLLEPDPNNANERRALRVLGVDRGGLLRSPSVTIGEGPTRAVISGRLRRRGGANAANARDVFIETMQMAIIQPQYGGTNQSLDDPCSWTWRASEVGYAPTFDPGNPPASSDSRIRHVADYFVAEVDGTISNTAGELVLFSSGYETGTASRAILKIVPFTLDAQSNEWNLAAPGSAGIVDLQLPPAIMAGEGIGETMVRTIPNEADPLRDDLLLVRMIHALDGNQEPEGDLLRLEIWRMVQPTGGLTAATTWTGYETLFPGQMPSVFTGNPGAPLQSDLFPNRVTGLPGSGDPRDSTNWNLEDVEVRQLTPMGLPSICLFMAGARLEDPATVNRNSALGIYALMDTAQGMVWRNVLEFTDIDPEVVFPDPGNGGGGTQFFARETLLSLIDLNGDDELDLLCRVIPFNSRGVDNGNLIAFLSTRSGVAGNSSTLSSGTGSVSASSAPASIDFDGDGVADIVSGVNATQSGIYFGREDGNWENGTGGLAGGAGSGFVISQVLSRSAMPSPRPDLTVDRFGDIISFNGSTALVQRIRQFVEEPRTIDAPLPTTPSASVSGTIARAIPVLPGGSQIDRRDLVLLQTDGTATLWRPENMNSLREVTSGASVLLSRSWEALTAVRRDRLSGTPAWRDSRADWVVGSAAGSPDELIVLDATDGTYREVQSGLRITSRANTGIEIQEVTAACIDGDGLEDLYVLARKTLPGQNRYEWRLYAVMQTPNANAPFAPVFDDSAQPLLQFHTSDALLEGSVALGANRYAFSNAEAVLLNGERIRFARPTRVMENGSMVFRGLAVTSPPPPQFGPGYLPTLTPSILDRFSPAVVDIDGDGQASVYFGGSPATGMLEVRRGGR